MFLAPRGPAVRNATGLWVLGQILAHALSLLALPMDALAGWRLSWVRLLLTAYDIFALYDFYRMGDELRNKRDSSAK